MSIRKLLSCLLVCLCACLVGGQTAMAFEYAEAAWCCDTIHYRVNPIDPNLFCGGSTAPGWFQSIIDQAAAVWNAQGTKFQLVNIGQTSLSCIPNPSPAVCVGPHDGQNVISMATTCNWVDNSVLAYSTWWYWTAGDSACCIYESDICFNRNVSWFDNTGTCSGSCYDLYSVALHEMGHWIASNHEPDQAALGYRPVMYPSFNFCEMRRVVTADDAALLSWAYDATGVITMPYRCSLVHQHPPYLPPPTHASCANCIPGIPDCDSITTDPCLLICPKSDLVFKVTVKDTCGNLMCVPTGGLWLDIPLTPGSASRRAWSSRYRASLWSWRLA